MAEPQTVNLSVKDVLKGILDGLQASKSLLINVGSGGVDIIQSGVKEANEKLDEAIDAVEKMIVGD